MASSGSVGTLAWSAKLDSNEFKKGVRKVKKQMKEAQKSVAESIKIMSKGFAIATTAVVGLTGALAYMTKQSAEVVNAQKILADSIGATQAEIAGMELVADSLGVSYDQLIDKMREFGGISEFKELADKVANATTATEQMKIAQEALGNEGLKLLPVLQQGASGLKAMEEEAMKLGLALPDDKVNALTTAWGAFEKAMQMVRGLTRQLSAELGGAFKKTFIVIQSLIETFRDNFIILFSDISEAYIKFINILVKGITKYGVPAFVALQNVIGEVGKAIATLFNLFTSSPVASTIDNWSIAVFDFGMTMRESLAFGLARVFQVVFDTIGKGLIKMLSTFNDVFQKLNKLFVKLGFKSELQGALDSISSNLQLESLKKGVNSIGGEIKSIVDVLNDDLELKLSDRLSIVDELSKKFGFNLEKFGFNEIKSLTNDEDGKKTTSGFGEEKRSGGTLATSGSVEEFNLLRDQRNQELIESKKQTKLLEKLTKTQPSTAGL